MGLTPDGLSVWQAEPGPLPLVHITIGEALDEAAMDAPDKEAVVVSGFADLGFDVRWTYRDLREAADRLARALIAAGLAPGDRVAIWAPNIGPWLVVEFAAAKAGLVLVTMNPTYRAAEAHYILTDTQARILFLLPQIRHFDLAQELAQVRDQLTCLQRVVSLGEDPPGTGVESYAEFLTRGHEAGDAALSARQAAVRPVDRAQIQYTSGTTGQPKGAMLTHVSLLNNARQFAARWEVTAAERWANPMPLFHTAGCAMVTLACVANRATQCLAVWFDPKRVLRLVEDESCTIVETVPTMVTALLDAQRQQRRNLNSLRLVGTGGAPVPAALGRRVETELGTDLRSVYGLTETSPLVAAAPAHAVGQRGWETAGPPLPHTDVRIVDPELQPVPVGQPGQLQVRGYLLMAGYLNRPGATRDVIDDQGWFSTGDIAQFDAQGWLRIVDRSKDVIIRGGENLYPAEIEAIITEHPAVAEACVVGVPDDYYGEEACAVVRRRPGAALDSTQLRDFLRVRVTHQKVPRHVLFVEAFPTTASGKIRKRDVAAQVRASLQPAADAPIPAEG
jgi:fatty-acyl-CoA synthase